MSEKLKYYDIREDILPGVWCVGAVSMRGPGKTYSSLRYCIEENKKFVLLRRTEREIKLILKDLPITDETTDDDTSPFAPLNRDFGWNIKAVRIDEGFLAFYHHVINDEGKEVPTGSPVGYCMCMKLIKDVKGFNLDVDVLIFDECAPYKWVREYPGEGDGVIDLYETLMRDRLKRGKDQILLLLLANTVNVNAPIFRTMELVDIFAEMSFNKEEKRNIDGILLHILSPERYKMKEDKYISGMEKHMRDTQYGAMAYKSEFGYNDFSNIRKNRLKGYKCQVKFKYNNKTFYIYQKDGNYHICQSKGKALREYDLSLENDQKLFFHKELRKLYAKLIKSQVTFDSYSAYNLIVDYKKVFTL